ncbi:unnamed protein product [Cuscuta epithymum]|uniref:Uncharacterized protein n=1 Tax=Cuscuta epithymum TaxID=186058 RepID=A0AAV0DU67_9ASTE|nr:unnamed protein product [Cuscuta epithymum]
MAITSKQHGLLFIIILIILAKNKVVSSEKAVQDSIFLNVAGSFAGAESGGSIDIEDAAEELMMESEVSRRFLSQSRYISYAAMQKDSIPCNRRGASYYNCRSHAAVRPYNRGCSKFTRCGGRYN